MSENTQTSVLLNSVALQLKAAWFRQTGIARAVTELVWEYLGIHASMSSGLVRALGNNKKAVEWLLWDKELPTNAQSPEAKAANDPKFEVLKTGTNG